MHELMTATEATLFLVWSLSYMHLFTLYTVKCVIFVAIIAKS